MEAKAAPVKGKRGPRSESQQYRAREEFKRHFATLPVGTIVKSLHMEHHLNLLGGFKEMGSGLSVVMNRLAKDGYLDKVNTTTFTTCGKQPE